MRRRYIPLFILLVTGLTANAQIADSTQLVREFIQISSSMKSAPLYLKLQVSSSSNIILSETDTANIEGEFFIQQGKSYIRFGEMEQFVNDSLALIVSAKVERMMLYAATKEMTDKMAMAALPRLQDSSVNNILKLYRASVSDVADQGKKGIELTSRALIQGTDLPRECVEMIYEANKKDPIYSKILRRSLVHVDPNDVALLPKDEKVISINGDQYVVKITSTVFHFVAINHSTEVKAPLTLNDRIYRSAGGDYLPAKSYQSYQLVIN